MVWPNVDWELLIWQPYLDISATPKKMVCFNFFFFVVILCSVMLEKFFLLEATSKCLKWQKNEGKKQLGGLGSAGDKLIANRFLKSLFKVLFRNPVLWMILLHHSSGAPSCC